MSSPPKPFDGLSPDAKGTNTAGLACPGSDRQSANAGPNDASAVCACGAQYLSGIARDAAALRARTQELVGKPRYNPLAASFPVAFTSDFLAPHYARANLLAENAARRSAAACQLWNSDRANWPAAEKTKQTVAADIDKLSKDIDAANLQHFNLVAQPNWWTNTTAKGREQALRTQLAGLYDQRQKDLLLAGTTSRTLATLDDEFHRAKRETYQDVETAAGVLFRLYVQEAADMFDQLNGDTDVYQIKNENIEWQGSTVHQWADASGNKDSLEAYAAPFDSVSPMNLTVILQRAQAAIDRVNVERNRLRADLKNWAAYSAHDFWPVPDLPYRMYSDPRHQSRETNFSFEEAAQMSLGGSYLHPDAADSSFKGPRTDLWFTPLDLPDVSGLQDMYDGRMSYVMPVFTAYVAHGVDNFLGRNYWPNWSGKVPDGVAGFEKGNGRPISNTAAMPQGDLLVLMFSIPRIVGPPGNNDLLVAQGGRWPEEGP